MYLVHSFYLITMYIGSLYAQSSSIRSGELLRLLDLKGDREPERDLEGLRDTYLEPASDGVRLRVLLVVDLLRLRLRLWKDISDLLLLLLRLRLRLGLLPLPSMASNKRLFLGPTSPFSSRISRFPMRGMMISQTRSSCKSWSTNSSIYVKV